MPLLTEEQLRAWTKTAQPGDDTAYLVREGALESKWYISKIRGRTAAGRINLEDGTTWLENGHRHGGSRQGVRRFCVLHPLTPEVKAEIARCRLVESARDNLYILSSKMQTFEKLDTADLQRLDEALRATLAKLEPPTEASGG